MIQHGREGGLQETAASKGWYRRRPTGVVGNFDGLAMFSDAGAAITGLDSITDLATPTSNRSWMPEAKKFKVHHASHRPDQHKRWVYFSIAGSNDTVGGLGFIQICCLSNALEQIHKLTPNPILTIDVNDFAVRFKPGLGWVHVAPGLFGADNVELLILALPKPPAVKERNAFTPRAQVVNQEFVALSELKRKAHAPFQHTARQTLGSLAIACSLIHAGIAFVAGVRHFDEGDWLFICDGQVHVGGHSDDQLVSIHAEHLLQQDPTLYTLADLPTGWAAERESPTGPWERFQLEAVRDE